VKDVQGTIQGAIARKCCALICAINGQTDIAGDIQRGTRNTSQRRSQKYAEPEVLLVFLWYERFNASAERQASFQEILLETYRKSDDGNVDKRKAQSWAWRLVWRDQAKCPGKQIPIDLYKIENYRIRHTRNNAERNREQKRIEPKTVPLTYEPRRVMDIRT
jgi:hypothetical protein